MERYMYVRKRRNKIFAVVVMVAVWKIQYLFKNEI